MGGCFSQESSDKYNVSQPPQPGWHQQYETKPAPGHAPAPLSQGQQQLPPLAPYPQIPAKGGRSPPKASAGPPPVTGGRRPSPLVTAASIHPPGTHHEVLWFPDAVLPCRQVNQAGGCHRGQNCKYSHIPTSLSRFLDVLRSAEKTLDICVYNITLDEISDLVIAAHKHGVRVRCISDHEQVSSAGSDIVRFQQAGIEVRTNAHPPPTGGAGHANGGRSGGWGPLMHHKFCLVDGKLLLNGSFNWSRSAVLSNQENVVIQDAPFLVSEFGREFEKMWAKFK